MKQYQGLALPQSFYGRIKHSRLIITLLALLVGGLFILLTASCSSRHYNPTAYQYVHHSELQSADISTVTIAPVNYGTPSRSYLNRHAASINRQVSNYISDSGYNLIDTEQLFLQNWREAELQHGALFNPGTGHVTAARGQALSDTLSAVFDDNPDLDAIIFTDIIEVAVSYQSGSQRLARWHGVQRSAHFEGTGRSVDRHFDWNQAFDGISLAVFIFNRDGKLVFHSIGGIQISQSIYVSNNRGTIRRRSDLLRNTREIEEGIQLALHPFIIMANYPGYPR